MEQVAEETLGVIVAKSCLTIKVQPKARTENDI